MKQIIYHLWFFIFCTGICSSCTDVQVTTWNPENSKLTISFSTNELDSRTVPGVNSLNENKVSEIACYLYFGNDGQTANANVVRQVSINTDDASTETVFVVSFTDEELADLAKNQTMTLYAIANPPTDLPKTGTTNIPTIKKHQLVDTDFSVGEQPETFVMDGQLSIGVSVKANGGLEYSFQNGDVLKLTRSAAKILLHVLANEVKDNGTTWSPITSAMKVSFHNGVKYGYIDAGTDIFLPENKANIAEGSSYYFSSQNSIVFNPDAKIKPTGSELEYIQQNSPFYSYPYQWTGVMDTTPYLMLVVPWVKEGDDKNSQNYVYYYYQIPINELQGKCLERNHCYKIFVDIKALGSKVPTEKVTLEPSYIVVEWGSPKDIPVTLKQYRYLVAEQNEYVMNNVNELTFPFITSHICKLENVRVLMDNIAVVKEITDISQSTTEPIERNVIQGKDQNEYLNNDTQYINYGVTPCSNHAVDGNLSITLDNENHTISISHILDNNTDIGYAASDRKYDYQPITIKFDIVHADNEQYSNKFRESFTVIQYPMMYVEAEWNTGGNIITGDFVTQDRQWEKNGIDRGYVFVNGNQTTTSKYYYNMVRGCFDNFDASNHNSCMYVITITALDSNSPYILGDPRTGQRLADTDLYSDWDESQTGNQNTVKAPAMNESTDRRLRGYNPTREDDSSINMIAPKFRIASSYSKLLGDFREKEWMRRRCATYQEQGYPAGRWRLPTEGELLYVQNLSLEGKIPHLFNVNNGYWTATRSFVYRNNGITEEWMGSTGKDTYSNSFTAGQPLNRGVVRPVYDEWYWTDKCDPKVFTWGDKPL